MSQQTTLLFSASLGAIQRLFIAYIEIALLAPKDSNVARENLLRGAGSGREACPVSRLTRSRKDPRLRKSNKAGCSAQSAQSPAQQLTQLSAAHKLRERKKEKPQQDRFGTRSSLLLLLSFLLVCSVVVSKPRPSSSFSLSFCFSLSASSSSSLCWLGQSLTVTVAAVF